MTESVSVLKGLKFNSEVPPTAKWKMNPTEARRNALLNSIATQRTLVKRERGETINLTKTVKKDIDGVITKVQVERHPRQWFWNANGIYHLQIIFGGVPIAFGPKGTNTTIVAGNLDDVDVVFSVVESSVRSGELDPKIDDASAKSKIGRRKKAS